MNSTTSSNFAPKFTGVANQILNPGLVTLFYATPFNLIEPHGIADGWHAYGRLSYRNAHAVYEPYDDASHPTAK